MSSLTSGARPPVLDLVVRRDVQGHWKLHEGAEGLQHGDTVQQVVVPSPLDVLRGEASAHLRIPLEHALSKCPPVFWMQHHVPEVVGERSSKLAGEGGMSHRNESGTEGQSMQIDAGRGRATTGLCVLCHKSR